MKRIFALTLVFLTATSLAIKLGGRDNNQKAGRDKSFNRHRQQYEDPVKVNVAVVLPHSMFKARIYQKEIMLASQALSEMDFTKAGLKF